VQRHYRYAIDRARRYAELAARARIAQHRMRELRSADDRIDRTGGNAQCASYAGFFIDPG
jgi:hypothetical protein